MRRQRNSRYLASLLPYSVGYSICKFLMVVSQMFLQNFSSCYKHLTLILQNLFLLTQNIIPCCLDELKCEDLEINHKSVTLNSSRISPQSRQSAKPFLKSSELELPQPLTRRRVCPPPPFGSGGGAHSLARKGVGESQFRRGDIHCGTLYL